MIQNSTEYKSYIERIQEIVYKGQEVKHLEHSFYQVGSEHVAISITAPESNKYFFGINSEYLDKADYSILVCGNDLCAFKIPSNVVKQWNLKVDQNTGRYLTEIELDKNEDWLLSIKKGEDGSAVKINEYFINLKRDDEIISEVMVTRKILGLDKD
ncbi:hypothetical protein [Clostridium drakei]|uniref:Uncharacterized protein n=1 Tax=Clostridium drakei TaxID=332101 RepID=A0A2U8DVQ6_9CLOT|nr:hypothetical protein [Clostridium drakei]AWI06720.1 hypothetical protein B9W14_20215 [Clostridium drakei]